MANDLDYLATRLHGRRSRLAEAGQLEGFCRLRDFSELGRARYPETQFRAPKEFQRRLAQDLVPELSGFLQHLEGTGADLLAWMLVRFQVEDIKVVLRGWRRQMPLERVEEFLLPLPPALALDIPGLIAANSLRQFIDRLPPAELRNSLRDDTRGNSALVSSSGTPPLFLVEAALDRGYFRELLARGQRLPEEDRELIQPILCQEVDAFHLMLAVRGRFHYGLTGELLALWHVPGSGISRDRFTRMLSGADVASVAALARGTAIDRLPEQTGANGHSKIDPSMLEALASKRFLHLSNRAFRRSPAGLGAVAGYVGIRRVEIVNLITISEGLARRTEFESLRRRLTPRPALDSVYV